MTARSLHGTGALAAALALLLTGCDGDSTETLGEPSPSPSAAAPTTAAPSASPGTLRGLAVYWVAESRSSFALYREFRDVPDVGGPVASAVAAMTRQRPLDPDYTTPWRPASRVTVTQEGSALTVDLSADAIGGTQVGSELAERAVQQLVYTATAAAQQAGAPASTVRVLVDGRPADAWGAVHLGEPTRRAPLVDVQGHAWVTNPQEGQRLAAGTVRFEGFGTSFEANFGWKITSSTGALVSRGSATGGTGDGGFGTFAFTAELEPGTYVVTVSTDDASGGAEGPGPAVDDKRFTVT
jgi:hypothetical protein